MLQAANLLRPKAGTTMYKVQLSPILTFKLDMALAPEMCNKKAITTYS